MAIPSRPDEKLAARSLPEQLRQAIHATFKGGLHHCALVGGTALAGYYAAHRISNDLDLFTGSHTGQAMAVVAVKNLTQIGAAFLDQQQSPTYFHAVVELDGYTFSVDIVLDENLHRVGSFTSLSSGVLLPDLETLLKMKIATLVSRCSEKDLYDLVWLTEHHRHPDINEWIGLGQQIDSGVSAESSLLTLTAAQPRQSACTFSEPLGVSSKEVWKSILDFKFSLQNKLVDELERTPLDMPLAKLVRRLKNMK